MLIAFEESGNFAFREDERFEPYILVAVIAPDSGMEMISAAVETIRQATGRPELKSNKMGKQLAEVARVIADLPLAAVAYAMDNEMMDRNRIAEFRLRQATRIEEVRRGLVARSDVSPEVLKEVGELVFAIGSPGLDGAMSHPEFAQFQAVPDLMVAAVNRAVGVFVESGWDNDHSHYSFQFDRKLPSGLSAGEKYVLEQGIRIVGSNSRFEVVLPDAWRDQVEHPFRKSFEEGDSLSANKLLADQQHVDSRDSDLVQIADILGGVLRRVILNPDPKSIRLAHEALEVLSRVLLWPNGDLVRVFRYKGALEPNLDHYRAVLTSPDPASDGYEYGPGGAVLLG